MVQLPTRPKAPVALPLRLLWQSLQMASPLTADVRLIERVQENPAQSLAGAAVQGVVPVFGTQ